MGGATQFGARREGFQRIDQKYTYALPPHKKY
jgi:hypothetical protein